MELELKKGERVIVAMSGGVDSSVTAMIAKNAGCHVIGITLKMFDSQAPVLEDAEKVAKFLNIQWDMADYSQTFTEDVIGYFIKDYKEARTPNPCSRCNRVAKTKYLFDQMQKYNATKILTGHYAKTVNINGQNFIAKAASAEKDQSYYLSLIDPFHANFLAFPLGGYEKTDVRKIAEENGLPVAAKKDSQEACFLQGGDYRDFLKPYSQSWRKGNIILNGKIVAENKGVHHYTVGQRRGLEISHSQPLYVKSVDGKTGDVVLAEKKDVFYRGVKLVGCSFYPDTPFISKNVTAKLRYRMNNEPCLMERSPDGGCVLLFQKAQFAPAPGQTAAIYDGDVVIGAGTINGTF